MHVKLWISILVIGLVISGAATYWLGTVKRRTIGRVRHAIAVLGNYNDLRERQQHQTAYPAEFASDQQVMAALQTAKKLKDNNKDSTAWRDEDLAAQTILCETFHRLGARDAAELLRETEGDLKRLPYILRRHLRETEERKRSVGQELSK